MKLRIIWLLLALLCGVVAFSQIETQHRDSLTITFPTRHFTNHFMAANQPVTVVMPVSLISIPVGKTSPILINKYSNTIPYHQRDALWKDILGFAGKIAVSAYEDNHSLVHYYPRQ